MSQNHYLTVEKKSASWVTRLYSATNNKMSKAKRRKYISSLGLERYIFTGQLEASYFVVGS